MSINYDLEIVHVLDTISKEKATNLIWNYSILCFPIIGEQENFNFWENENRQRNLYRLFHIIDTVGYTIYCNTTSDEKGRGLINESVLLQNSIQEAMINNINPEIAAYILGIAFLGESINNSDTKWLQKSFKFLNQTIKNNDLRSKIQYELLEQDLGNIDINLKEYNSLWAKLQIAFETVNCSYWFNHFKNISNANVKIIDILEKHQNIPEEIKITGASEVGWYLNELDKGSVRLNEARIIVLGDKGSGKTSISKRLINPNELMPQEDESTAGVDKFTWTINNRRGSIKVNIWDFAGHTVTHSVHQFFLSERCLYLMVYDGRTEDRNRLTFWLDHMKNYGGNSKAIILVNVRDKHKVDIPINNLKEKYPILDIYYFSIKDDKEKLLHFRKNISEFILENASWKSQDIPKTYYDIKEELEELFDKYSEKKRQEYISLKVFEELAEKHKIENKNKLLSDLHNLGITLWYKDIPGFKTLILNPEWISHGVYKIINWLNYTKQHIIHIEDFKSVFKSDIERYPTEDDHIFLFNLMLHYELAYVTNENSLIIPHLLSEDRPEKLPQFSVGESLLLKYKSEQPLPADTISRFIVRRNHQISSSGNVWRYGVLLEKNRSTIALVREEDRTITVSVKGPLKSEYLYELREEINNIFKSYKIAKPELQYYISTYGEIPPYIETNDNQLWLGEAKIKNHVLQDRPYYDDVLQNNIPLNRIANIYKIQADNVLMGNSNIENLNQNIFNFKDINIKLQGELNELSTLLLDQGHINDSDRLTKVSKLLEEIENIQSKEDVVKKGLFNQLRQVVVDIGDKETALYKSISSVQNGFKIAKNVGRYYNGIAEWVGWPQIPKVFLGKRDSK